MGKEGTGFSIIREGRAEAIAKGAPRREDLAPEGRGVRVEVGEGAIGEEKGAWVLGVGRVGGTDPMEGEKAVWVVSRFKEATDSAYAQGAGKDSTSGQRRPPSG